MYHQTWLFFKQHHLDQVDLFEDPIYCTYIEKSCFIDVYRELLEKLDGSYLDDFVDFYYEPSPLNNCIMVFRNEDMRNDFRDYAIELNLIPNITEVMEGESKLDKENRKKLQRIQQPKKTVPEHKKMSSRSQQAQKTISTLMKKLENETDSFIRQKLQTKIKKTLAYVEHSF